MFLLSEKLFFPPVDTAMEDGLLAVGGDLSLERLELAYQSGIFPWYDGDLILWWSPDPRFVLFPEKLKITKSMQQVLRSNRYRFTVNTAFGQVVGQCKTVKRNDQTGTWINTAMEKAYLDLHQKGTAISAEAWYNNKLVGGLYGVLVGKVFCGESMFTLMPNASKFCFIRFVDFLKTKQVKIIDCQVYTEHLESMGAEMIPRYVFLHHLK